MTCDLTFDYQVCDRAISKLFVLKKGRRKGDRAVRWLSRRP